MSRDDEEERERPERAHAGVAEDLEPARAAHVGARCVGDVGEAVLVQRSGDQGGGGDREQGRWQGREGEVGERPHAGGDAPDEQAHDGEPLRRRAERGARRRGDGEAGEEGERGAQAARDAGGRRGRRR